MPVESKLHTLLTGSTLVNTITSNRVYPLLLPQQPTLPALMYTRIASSAVNVFEGRTELINPTIQIDAFSTSYSVIKTLGVNIHKAINTATDFSGVLLNDRDEYDDEQRVFRLSQDYSLWNQDT